MPSPGVIIGSTVLLHAIYSSYEYVSSVRLSGGSTEKSLPADITTQIILGLVIILLSSISSGIRNMEPIKVTNKNINDTLKGDEKFAYLETRPNFQDIIARRKIYLDWRKTQNLSSEKQ